MKNNIICPVCSISLKKTNNRQIYCSRPCFDKIYYLKNKNIKDKAHKQYYIKNKTSINKKRKNRIDNIPINKKKALYKKYNLVTKEYRRKYWNVRRKKDPIYAFNKDLSRNLSISLNRLNYKKDSNFYKIINTTKLSLLDHIKNQFNPEWTFKNRGKIWDIGHRIPLSWFKTKNELIKYGWNIKNLFPIEQNFNRNIQRNWFALINNKKIYNKEEAIKELYGVEK